MKRKAGDNEREQRFLESVSDSRLLARSKQKGRRVSDGQWFRFVFDEFVYCQRPASPAAPAGTPLVPFNGKREPLSFTRKALIVPFPLRQYRNLL